MAKVSRIGSVVAKGNKTDAEFQTFRVAEIHGDLYYYNSNVSDWCSLPESWLSKVTWNTPAPDPAHDVTGNGIESHYDLARQLEMRGYTVDADPDDMQHSYVRFEGVHVGDINGDEEATVTSLN